MGRLPNNEIYGKKNQSGFTDMRKKHRDADCKYRSKVQYLYFKIKSLLRKKTAKDGLLDNALGFIQDMEAEVYETHGSDHMENCKLEFLNFLMQEELIWKEEKDLTKWWTKVDDLLNKNHPVNSRVQREISIIKDKKKSVKRPYSRKSLKSSKNLNKSGTSYCVNEHVPTLPSHNKELLNISVDKPVRNKVVFPSSWIVPDFRPFVFNNNKDSATYGETLSNNNSSSSNSNDIFSTEFPLQFSCVAVPVDNSSINAMEYSQEAQSSVFYL